MKVEIYKCTHGEGYVVRVSDGLDFWMSVSGQPESWQNADANPYATIEEAKEKAEQLKEALAAPVWPAKPGPKKAT